MRPRPAELIAVLVGLALLAGLLLPAIASSHMWWWHTNTRIASGPSGTIFTDSATFTFTSPEDGGFQCRLDSDEWWDWRSCTSPQSYSSLADGAHTFEVRALNRPGHPDPTPAVANFTVVVDRQPPETTIDSGPSGTIAASSATFAFASAEPGAFQCRLDSSDPSAWSPCASPQSHASLADGPHVFEVRAVDEAGNTDQTPAVATFAVDTEPPETTITSAPSGTIDVAAATFAFTSSESGSFRCRLDSDDPDDWSPCASPQSYASLAEGPHAFEVRSLDGVDNLDQTPAVATFAIDTEPPETTITSAPSGTIDVAAATFAFTSSESGSFRCRLDSSGPSAWSPCASPQSYASLAEGPHAFEVRAVDRIGNVESIPEVAPFTVDTGPPKPVAGETVNLEPVKGTIELQCPGEDKYSKLTSFKQVPLGCLINTRRGVVDLTASKGQSGQLQGGHFWGGVFITSQKAGDDQEVELKLAGRRMCERRTGRKPVAVLSRAGGKGRKLWGNGKGNFKTSGSYGSATVRGTTWLVVDRCDSSTLIKVGEGTVLVRDFVKGKSLTLTTGEQYTAKASIPRLNPDLLP
jgi:hypothetical protein